MSLLWLGIFLLLALPMWIYHLPGLYGRKHLGHVLQWHNLAMSGLRGTKWIRQPVRVLTWRGVGINRKISR
jgi:hypothetical protein